MGGIGLARSALTSRPSATHGRLNQDPPCRKVHRPVARSFRDRG
jgi:hypothetical protein